MTTKASIYSEKDRIGGIELLNQLKDAVVDLEEKMKASTPIVKSGVRIGWGVNKAQRGIAADSVISVVRAIKALRGW